MSTMSTMSLVRLFVRAGLGDNFRATANMRMIEAQMADEHRKNIWTYFEHKNRHLQDICLY